MCYSSVFCDKIFTDIFHFVCMHVFVFVFLQFDPPVSTEPAGEHTVLDEGRQLPKPFISDKCYDDGRLLPEHIIESDGSVTLTEKGRLQVSINQSYLLNSSLSLYISLTNVLPS